MGIDIDLNYLAWMIGWAFVLLIFVYAFITINIEMEEKKEHGDIGKLPNEESADIPTR